jgi:hypothetical protein
MKDLRELIDVPSDLETVQQRLDEVTGLRTMNRILPWRKWYWWNLSALRRKIGVLT